MTNAEIIASIIGPFYLVVGFALFLNPDGYRRMTQDFFEHPASIYMGGIMALFMGLLVLAFHSNWSGDWTAIITVFGWLAAIKGAVLIIRPDSLAPLTRSMMGTDFRIRATAVGGLLLGLFLTAKGYAVL